MWALAVASVCGTPWGCAIFGASVAISGGCLFYLPTTRAAVSVALCATLFHSTVAWRSTLTSLVAAPVSAASHHDSRIRAKDVQLAAQLLSYKGAEDALRVAARRAGINPEALELRGRLERLLPELQEELRALPMQRHFLCALGALAPAAAAGGGGAAGPGRAVGGAAGGPGARPREGPALAGLGASEAAGLELASRLAAACCTACVAADSDGSMAALFRPPLRSLVGEVLDARWARLFDVALNRDRLDGHSRFTMILGSAREKGKQFARVLGEVDADGQPYLRGMHVHEDERGQGLSKLVLLTWLLLCFKCFDRAPRTRLIDKPLIALALHSLGFVADDQSWPVFVAADKDVDKGTLLCPEDPLDTRPHLNKSMLKAQRITLTKCRPVGARRIHIRSCFRHPEPDALRQSVEAESNANFHSARAVAFFAAQDETRWPLS